MGRPTKSAVRDRIIKILREEGSTWGYNVYKKYKRRYGKITLKSIYYNLNKGIELGDIKLIEIKEEAGDFSWGNKTERKYYEAV